MKKHEFIAALDGLDDDIEIWMECDAGFAPVGSADYQTYHPDNEDQVIVVLVPLT
ncbi:MAG TPA: hypothetical protein PLU16_15070 [Gallionellaceae bacterium]|jgi:hypothetical protein|nr:hypothetical protein [Gallionellaceae bacterium]HQS76527.1 hypothetical protein [Gallionellaceae bacterium]